MIARAYRFRGKAGLRYVYKNGHVVRGRHLSLRFVANSQKTKYRCAVVVSRRVHKSAVERNRLRRRIYEAVRLASRKINRPYDMVFTVLEYESSSLTAEELQKEINGLLARAGITHKAIDRADGMIKQQEK